MRAYWLDVQHYFVEQPAAGLFLAGETIKVQVPAGDLAYTIVSIS